MQRTPFCTCTVNVCLWRAQPFSSSPILRCTVCTEHLVSGSKWQADKQNTSYSYIDDREKTKSCAERWQIWPDHLWGCSKNYEETLKCLFTPHFNIHAWMLFIDINIKVEQILPLRTQSLSGYKWQWLYCFTYSTACTFTFIYLIIKLLNFLNDREKHSYICNMTIKVNANVVQGN